jgi:hypothetical protein
MTGGYRSREDVERALQTLARTIKTPSHPDYADRVLQQLADEATSSRSSRTGPPRLGLGRSARRLLLAAAVVLISCATVIAIPGTRHALASWFGFGGIDIRTAPTRSTTPGSTPAPPSTDRHVTLQDAQRAATGRLALPGGLRAPDRVYLRRDGKAVIVTLAYRTASTLQPTPDTGYALVITEIFDAGDPVLEKLLHTGATATPLLIGDWPGVFIEGPQEVINVEHTMSNGTAVVHEVAPRTSANTLIWSNGAATYRLEGQFTRQVALNLAHTLQ